ncbi:MAG: DUF3592 domain-containing protein [Saprospiraceae bacterium]|nr:DUF3592 domain-containing protein [Saprospiraceae bacterium]
MMQRLFITAFLGLFCAVFCGSAIQVFQESNQIISNGVQVEGRVVWNEAVDGSDGITYRPAVEFQLPSGEQHIASPSSSSNPASYSIGDPIHIAYIPDNPDKIIINSYFWRYIFPGIFFLIGLFTGFLSLGILFGQINEE